MGTKICFVVTMAAVLSLTSVSPAAAQFGAIRDAARRAEEAKKAEDAKKAEEAKRKAEEEKKTNEEAAKKSQGGNQPAATPATTPPPATSATPAAAAPAPASSQAAAAAANSGTAPPFEAYSKFDFVPGEKIIALEDLTEDAIGDFPAKWDTNASAEIVTISGQTGRFLKLTKAGFFTPDFVTDLPENVTVEFDLMVPPDFSAGFPLEFALAQVPDRKKMADWESGPNSAIVTASLGYGDASQGLSTTTMRQDGTSAAPNTAKTNQLGIDGKVKHVAMWRQRQRLRVYMNQEKVWDLPRAISASAKLNSLVFFVRGGCGNCEYYLANLRIAAGAPDTRNKLLTEGKWVTHGILFDVNSDKIKAESYGSLKEIAGVLTENADLKITIIGHTDSDGDAAANMDLSKRRAASVKAALTKEFNIDGGRMDTDGKGATQPVDKNDNPAGKANNRRVEFIKK